MNIIDGQINLGLDLDLKPQNETKANDRLRVYKLRVAKRLEYIIFGIYILHYANCFYYFGYLFYFTVVFLVLIFYKYLILNGLS